MARIRKRLEMGAAKESTQVKTVAQVSNDGGDGGERENSSTIEPGYVYSTYYHSRVSQFVLAFSGCGTPQLVSCAELINHSHSRITETVLDQTAENQYVEDRKSVV